jgi:hypothetical protein
MNPNLLLLVAIPLLVVGFGFSVRPLPLRVNASDPAERTAQRCRRISFLLLAIPAAVTGLVVALIIRKYSGGPGLMAYRNYLSVAGALWKISSIAGILSGLGGSFFSKKRGEGYELVAAHVILLFIAIVGPYFQYAGHPD